jgi:Phosphoribosyl transferase domain
MGAIASGGVRVLNPDVAIGMSKRATGHVAERERTELKRRKRAYRGDRPPEDPAGKVLVLVDDGLATGSSMRAAVAALRQRRPARIIAAVPASAPLTWLITPERCGSDRRVRTRWSVTNRGTARAARRPLAQYSLRSWTAAATTGARSARHDRPGHRAASSRRLEPRDSRMMVTCWRPSAPSDGHSLQGRLAL